MHYQRKYAKLYFGYIKKKMLKFHTILLFPFFLTSSLKKYVFYN